MEKESTWPDILQLIVFVLVFPASVVNYNGDAMSILSPQFMLSEDVAVTKLKHNDFSKDENLFTFAVCGNKNSAWQSSKQFDKHSNTRRNA